MAQQNILIVSKQAKTYSEEEVIKVFNESNDLDEIKKVVESAVDRLYTSWATVDAVDKDRQKVPIDEAIKQKEILMKRGSPIQDTHTNKNIGKTLAYRVLTHPETNTIGILDLNKIYNDNILDDKVWTETVDGKRQGSSVGGFSTDKEFVSEGGDIFESLKGFNWLETSNVESGCNPFATNQAVSLIAKNDKMVEEKTTEVIKQEEEVSTETPEVSMEDRVVALEEGLGAVMAKLDELVQATAGTPEVEKEEEEEMSDEEKAEDEEKEVEKEADNEEEETAKEEEDKEESEVAKSLKEMKSELEEVKKKLEDNKVVEVVKTEMPETKVEAETQKHTFTDVMKGKASMKEFLGEQ